MLRVAKDMHIARPAEEVFDFLANASNESNWNTSVLTIEKTSTGPIGPGTRFLGSYKRVGTLDTVITTFERPTRLGFHSEGRTMHMDFTFTFAPEAGGTAVHAIADIQPRGFLRVLAPLMGGVMDREFSSREPSLKRALEGERPQPAASEAVQDA